MFDSIFTIHVNVVPHCPTNLNVVHMQKCYGPLKNGSSNSAQQQHDSGRDSVDVITQDGDKWLKHYGIPRKALHSFAFVHLCMHDLRKQITYVRLLI